MLKKIIYCFSGIYLLLLSSFVGKAQDALSLEQAIEIGLKNNFDIQIANKNRDIAGINNHWGNAGRFPTISFNASGSASPTYRSSSDDMTNYNASSSVNLEWVLFDGFRVNITKQKLQDLDNLSGGQAAVVVEDAIRKIISAWYLALIEQEKTDVQQDMMKLSKDRYDQSQRLTEIGSSTKYDLLQAQNAWLEDQGNYLSQKVNAKNARRNLYYVMGSDASKVSWQIVGDLKAKDKDFVMSDLVDKMYRDNNNLKNQYINQKLMVDEQGLAKANMFPKISFNAAVTEAYSKVDPPIPTGSQGWSTSPSVSLKLSYNLFNGGNRKRAIQIANINKDISDLKIDDMKISLSNQLSQYYDLYEVNKELLKLASEQVKASKLNLDISKQKFRSGAINSFNFRDVQVMYLNAQTAHLNALYKLQLSYVDLVTITGGVIAEYSSK
ncbi:TolC family protein [Halosquirtibacter xylanolyticus]|uniref:TolC family protein n=1 Tax=Halosquirtibacter xylanolyticus TaxID=3374599 RepID=UPI00374825F4|nr:TolC family protein [Prolixibacteraceae bacterium]